MEGLFPKYPKDLSKLSDKELADLLAEHETAMGLIQAKDEEFLGDRSADEIVADAKEGRDAILALREETAKRDEDASRFEDELSEIGTSLEAPAEAKAEAEGDDDAESADDAAEPADDEEAEEPEAAVEVADPVVEKVPVLASADAEAEPTPEPVQRPMRRVPTPAPDRVAVSEPEKKMAFVASGMVPAKTGPGGVLETSADVGDALYSTAKSVGSPTHTEYGREERFLVASLDYRDNYPDDRVLHASDVLGNSEKIAKAGSPYFGRDGIDALVASGGFCAPLEPIYTMPQLATNARPVRDALPNFRADRGGINVPTPTTIGDATGAITVITADADAAGGTFATKACLDMDCPDYSEYAVTVISHCREFGNLNAMAWPEKIRHENELTMAEHARVAESYLLAQIKNLSINVASGAETLGALIYLMDAITKSQYGIRARLRLPREARFTALLPAVALDILLLDTIQNQFDRYRTRGDIEAYLGSVGVDVTWYLDTAQTFPGHDFGLSQIPTSAQTGTTGAPGTLSAFPDQIEWALFPAGTFLHLDMASLELGIVRDSTLNSTNDFQIFGESFENVARIGPQSAAYWEVTDICAVGSFPPAGTARTCD